MRVCDEGTCVYGMRVHACIERMPAFTSRLSSHLKTLCHSSPPDSLPPAHPCPPPGQRIPAATCGGWACRHALRCLVSQVWDLGSLGSRVRTDAGRHCKPLQRTDAGRHCNHMPPPCLCNDVALLFVLRPCFAVSCLVPCGLWCCMSCGLDGGGVACHVMLHVMLHVMQHRWCCMACHVACDAVCW